MNNTQFIEDTERAVMHLVVRAFKDFFPQAKEIFRQETDLPQDVSEDCTTEALQTLGASNIRHRLFGKIDYKKAVWLFFPDREQAAALFVDSKAEKPEGAGTATIQLTQTSLEIRMIRSGKIVHKQGLLPTKISSSVGDLQVVTIFVKYVYSPCDSGCDLKYVTVFCIPSGELQAEYNPNEHTGFWLAGRNAPSRGEEFHVRVKLSELKEAADWRVIDIAPHV